MKNRIPLLLSLIIVMSGFIAWWGCNGGGSGGDDGDGVTDGIDQGDIFTDVDGITDPFQEDMIGDIPDVTGEDMEEEEMISPGEGQPYQCVTSGGALLESDNYKLEVFIAPVRPIGTTSSTNYKLKLGPAGVRSP